MFHYQDVLARCLLAGSNHMGQITISLTPRSFTWDKLLKVWKTQERGRGGLNCVLAFKTFPFFSMKAFLFFLSVGVSEGVEDEQGILSWFTCKPQATSSPPRKVIWPCAQGNPLIN